MDSIRVDTGLRPDITNRFCLVSLGAIKDTDPKTSNSREDREDTIRFNSVLSPG
jgi:hypothetical protein